LGLLKGIKHVVDQRKFIKAYDELLAVTNELAGIVRADETNVIARTALAKFFSARMLDNPPTGITEGKASKTFFENTTLSEQQAMDLISSINDIAKAIRDRIDRISAGKLVSRMVAFRVTSRFTRSVMKE
jgi:hypothetical protein